MDHLEKRRPLLRARLPRQALVLMTRLLCSVFCILYSSAAVAQEAELSGLLVTAVTIEIEGRREAAADLRALIETREGMPLDPRLARESIAQLYAAGRFADVRV